MPLGAAGEAVAEGRELLHHFRRMALGAVEGAHLLAHIGKADVVERRDAIPHPRFDMPRQEVRQLHEVAVGVEDDPVAGVGHGRVRGRPPRGPGRWGHRSG